MEQDTRGDSPDLETLLQDIRAMKSALHRHDRLIRQILLLIMAKMRRAQSTYRTEAGIVA